MRDTKAEHLARGQATGLTELAKITARAQAILVVRLIRVQWFLLAGLAATAVALWLK